ncbi:MAG: hypothetical protein IJS60_04890 [Abditibacteriota bacterium]|nr:hypothetical protein [Abditibacteriota bacterium]
MCFFNWKIPLAHGFVIDDVGWLECSDLTEKGGPPRLHCDRKSNIDDYKQLVDLAEALGVRIFCAFVMSEFDRGDICGKPIYNKPLAPMDMTEYGLNWHCPISDTQTQIMDFVKNNAHAIDFAIHGVRHGHYGEGLWEVSEWARRAKKDEKGRFCEEIKIVTPWDKENKTDRLIAECFRELIRQYFTEEELPFPESFVPPNHSYFYEENCENTTGAVLSDFGVKYCNFKHTGSGSLDYNFKPVVNWDHNLCLLDRRGIKGSSYKRTGAKPKFFPRAFPYMEAHFNNIWGTVEEWKKYLYNVNRHPGRMLGKNTEQVFSQWIYHKFAKIKNYKNKIVVDCRSIPQEAYAKNILSTLTLKIWLGKKEISTFKTSNGAMSDRFTQLCCYYKDKYGYGYVTVGNSENSMGRLDGVYSFEFEVGKEPLDFYVDNSDLTAQVYSVKSKDRVWLKVYGTQKVRIKTHKPERVESSNPKVQILSWEYKEGFLEVLVKGTSMLGDVTCIRLSFPLDENL